MSYSWSWHISCWYCYLLFTLCICLFLCVSYLKCLHIHWQRAGLKPDNVLGRVLLSHTLRATRPTSQHEITEKAFSIGGDSSVWQNAGLRKRRSWVIIPTDNLFKGFTPKKCTSTFMECGLTVRHFVWLLYWFFFYITHNTTTITAFLCMYVFCITFLDILYYGFLSLFSTYYNMAFYHFFSTYYTVTFLRTKIMTYNTMSILWVQYEEDMNDVKELLSCDPETHLGRKQEEESLLDYSGQQVKQAIQLNCNSGIIMVGDSTSKTHTQCLKVCVGFHVFSDLFFWWPNHTNDVICTSQFQP